MWRFARMFRRFSNEQTGVIAVEFAMIAVPFIGMIVIILESFLLYHQANRLDRATQSLASDLRSGKKILKDLTAESARSALCPMVTPMVSCSSIQVRLYDSPTCKTDGTCWRSYYADFAQATRRKELPSGDSFTIGAAGSSQYLVVYYPSPIMSKLWDTRSVDGVDGAGKPMHGIYSTAMWINDPSVGVF